MEKRRTGSNENKRRGTGNRRGVILLILLTLAAGIALAFFYGRDNNRQGARQTPSPSPAGPAPTETVSPGPEPAATETAEPGLTPTSEPTPNPDEDRRSTRKSDVKVRALYLNPTSVRNRLDHYIDLANRTEINAFVIDIKRDDGVITYDSDIPDVNAANADTAGFDIREVTKKLHDNGIIAIARLVTFKDTTITKYKPELAIKTKDGGILETPESGGGKSRWLDPTNRGSWDYILSIVQEAVKFGFDEIQFDYIRFPETSLYKNYVINLGEGEERHEVIEKFIRYIRNNLPADTVLSADVFGMPLISTKDYGEIGQSLESIGWSLDYICPMIYPSHFANNSNGTMGNGVGQTINGINFTHPDLKPYDVVYNTLIVGKKRIESVDGYNLKVRPYIQGFTASYLPSGYYMRYGVNEYRAQIKAVYDAGYDEWIFWNSRNEYVEDAFLPQQ